MVILTIVVVLFRPYQCRFCDKAYFRRYLLTNHVKSRHPNEKIDCSDDEERDEVQMQQDCTHSRSHENSKDKTNDSKPEMGISSKQFNPL